MKLKRKWLTIGIALCLAIVLSGCSQSQEASGTKNKNGLQKVSIMLDWYPNAVHSAIYTAVKEGYFKKEGLDVDIKMPAETNDPLKLVAAGKIDLALSYQPQVVISRAEDIPVVSLAALVRHPLNYLMVPEKSKIKTPKDLAGKNIGYPSIPTDEAIVKTMVDHDGGSIKNVKMTDVGFDLMPAVSTNKVDGIIGGYINHEKILLGKEGHPMRAINPAKYGVPDYYELVLVASSQGLEEKKGVYKKFWKAVSEGQQYVQKNPEQGLQILLDHENQDFKLDKQVEKESLNILLPLMDAKDEPFGTQDEKTWQDVADWLYKTDVVKKKVNIKDAFVNIAE